MRAIYTTPPLKNVRVRVIYDDEWSEYIGKPEIYTQSGIPPYTISKWKTQPAATWNHTDDKEDAIDTALCQQKEHLIIGGRKKGV